MIKIKKSNGFTLIEGALVAGIVTIAASAIYSVYSQKNTENLVDKQVSMVEQMHNSLNDYLSSADHTSHRPEIQQLIENQSKLIPSKIIPAEMIGPNNKIKSVWGGDVTLDSYFQNGLSKYTITFDNVPKEACVRFVSSHKIKDISENISVNGVNSDPKVACNSRNNSSITLYVNPLKTKIEQVEFTSTGITGSVRGKELSQFIAPINKNMRTPTSCFGGSSWNSNVGACTCPASSKWNGKQCVPFGVDGVCDIGEFWNQKTRSCQTLCSANEKFDPFRQACVSEPATLKTFCIPGVSNSCITSPSKILAGSTYQAGRHIPNTVFQEPQRSAINGLNTNIVFTAQTNRMQPL